MKIEIVVPTVQFGKLTYMFEGTVEEAIAEHNKTLLLYNGGFGLEPKEYNKALDRYLTDGTGETETYLKMNKEQQQVFQEIKKSMARIKRKNGDNN